LVTLTRESIKPQPKRVQAILALNPPHKVKELRHFLRMVKYYLDMWAKRSEMLASLSDLVGECGETKATRKNKVKKKPWHWDSIHQIASDNVKSTSQKSSYILTTIEKGSNPNQRRYRRYSRSTRHTM